MQERDVLDLLLVAIVGALAYVETFGLADPAATVDEIVAVLLTIDVRVYLVVGGVFGIAFVGYITVYLPRKDAARSVR